MSTIKNVIIGMSGGVDSSVSAYLLKEQGYNVTGVYMNNWNTFEEGSCPTQTDWNDVQFVAERLEIPVHRISFAKQYWNSVFTQMISQLNSGLTPNPDILCNSQIKFKEFFGYAIHDKGADYIATGHYAQIRKSIDNSFTLHQALDLTKDQSYFLCNIQSLALSKTLFPVGNMKKSQVRTIARNLGLHKVAEKDESMGICFIGKRRSYKEFIQEHVNFSPGNFISVEDSRILGRHEGLPFYTIGQRARLPGLSKAHYICFKNMEHNTISLVDSQRHSSLAVSKLQTKDFVWISGNAPNTSGPFLLVTKSTDKIGHPVHIQMEFQEPSSIIIILNSPQFCVSPGQYAALYKDGQVFGGGWISATFS